MGMVAISLGVTLLGLSLSFRVHRHWGPLLLGAASGALVMIALVRSAALAVVLALGLPARRGHWNFLLNRRSRGSRRA